MQRLYRDDLANLAALDQGRVHIFENVFTPQECDQICHSGDGVVNVASTGYEPGEFSDLRQSKTRWIHGGDGTTDWVFERLRTVVLSANATMKFDLCDLNYLQFTEYDVSYSGHYDYHVDFGTGPSLMFRKLTVIVQLTDPADYDGCELFVGTAINTRASLMEVPVCKARGCVLVFPSFLVHRVSPITRGMRRSLVGWVEGPPYR